MRLVSDNSDDDIALARAKWEVEACLRELTANLLRVTRGAGRPWEVGKQAADLVRAYQAHWDAANVWPSSQEVSDALSIEDERRELSDREYSDRYYAERSVVRGALQVAASRLLEQRTQEAAGSSELYDGVNRIIDVREKQRRERATQSQAFTKARTMAAAQAARRKAAGKKKPRPSTK